MAGVEVRAWRLHCRPRKALRFRGGGQRLAAWILASKLSEQPATPKKTPWNSQTLNYSSTHPEPCGLCSGDGPLAGWRALALQVLDGVWIHGLWYHFRLWALQGFRVFLGFEGLFHFYRPVILDSTVRV